MQHKGLIYTLSIIACLAFFISIIGIGLNSKSPTSFAIESYPSGAKVFLNGELLGKTPFTLNENFFKKHNINCDKATIFKLFTPTQNGIEIVPSRIQSSKKGEEHLLFTFEIPTKKGAIPQRFSETNPDKAEFKTVKIRAFVSHEFSNRMIVSFDIDKLAPLDAITKSQSTLTLFVPSNKDIALSAMSEYKNFKRISTPSEK